MTKKEAQKILDSVCKSQGKLFFTHHFWQRRDERLAGLDKNQIYGILRDGSIFGRPVLSTEYKNFKIKVRGVDLDYREVEIVIGISRNEDSVCITCYEIKEVS